MLSTSKIMGSINREVRSLATSIDECATQFLALHPDSGLTVLRVPERFVLQAGDIGVSLSFFSSRDSTEVAAEVVLAVWHGEVTFPGRTPREGQRATQLSTQQFHIMPCDDASWLWMDETTSDTMTSRALATMCVDTMAERLALQLDTADRSAS
jgi:hypothetical protein